MRYVLVDLSSDNYLQQPQLFGGYAGEHNETVLQVILPKRMISVEYSDYCFDFQTSEGNRISIPASKLNNGILSCHLTEQITIAGKLLFNVVVYLSNKDTIELTSKTNMVALYIGDSPDGKSVLPDPNGYKDEILEIIDDRVDELLEGIQVGEGGMIIIDQSYNSESGNAQSGKAVAEAVKNKADRNKILDYITYTIESDNTVTITGCSTDISGKYIIPDVIDGCPVVKLGNAFASCTKLTDIIIPNSVIYMQTAFPNCTSLANIIIPDSVVDLGSSSFASCTGLTNITIPDSVTTIGMSTFNGCTNLRSVTIPNTVTLIESAAFLDCSNLTDIYYIGTEEEWKEIEIMNPNTTLSDATIHYNQKLATEDFVLKNGGSGSGTVDQSYNPESENSQSGIAVAEAVKSKIAFWAPSVEYKVGDMVLRKHTSFANDGSLLKIYYVDVCKQNHTSIPVDDSTLFDDNNGYWNSYENLLLEKSYCAKSDFNGNVIDKTYATKDEVSHLLSAGLTRQIYPSLTDITPSEEFANVIVMTPNTSTDTANVYDEYIATLDKDGKYYFELIGSTAVDLTDYATKEDLSTKMDKFCEVSYDDTTETVNLSFVNDVFFSCSEIKAALSVSAQQIHAGVMYVTNEMYDNDLQVVNKGYVDSLIGDINSVLATIVDGVE